MRMTDMSCHRRPAPFFLHLALVLFLSMDHWSRDRLPCARAAIIFHGSVISLENMVTSSEVASESRSTQKDFNKPLFICFSCCHTLRNLIAFLYEEWLIVTFSCCHFPSYQWLWELLGKCTFPKVRKGFWEPWTSQVGGVINVLSSENNVKTSSEVD